MPGLRFRRVHSVFVPASVSLSPHNASSRVPESLVLLNVSVNLALSAIATLGAFIRCVKSNLLNPVGIGVITLAIHLATLSPRVHPFTLRHKVICALKFFGGQRGCFVVVSLCGGHIKSSRWGVAPQPAAKPRRVSEDDPSPRSQVWHCSNPRHFISRAACPALVAVWRWYFQAS